MKWFRENLEEVPVDLLVVMYGLGDVLRDGTYTKGMPIMIGHTRDESTLFTMLNPAIAGMDRNRLIELAARPFGDNAKAAVECYEDERASLGYRTGPADIWAAISTRSVWAMCC